MRSRLALLALEPRMMFDGAAVATAAEASHDAAPDTSDSSGGNTPSDNISAALADVTPPAASSGGQVYFIDGAIQDREAILAAIPAEARVIVLDPARDGVAQIAEALVQYSDLSAIHVISHGAVGEVNLGSVTLSGDNADAYAGTLGQWGLARRQAWIPNPGPGQGDATSGWKDTGNDPTLGSLTKRSRVSHIRAAVHGKPSSTSAGIKG